jgi:hypothetical protein
MTPLLIAQLIGQVGLPLAQQLVGLYHAGNAPITAEQWTELAKLGRYSSADSLAKAGIRIDENGKAQPLAQ